MSEPSNSAHAIVTRHLTKRFKGHVAVRGLSLEIPRGSIFGLLGPNGAGKSTTLGLLTTLLRPSAGEAWVNGHSILTAGQRVRESIGVVFQNSTIDRDLSILDNLSFGARLFRMSAADRAAQITRVLKITGLEERARQKGVTLSGGLRRRLEIARALLHTPKVLFLDEPTTGLDPESRRTIWRELLRLRKENDLTIVITTHYLEEADHLADLVAVMDDGKVQTQGSPAELKRALGGDVVRASVVHPRETLARELGELSGIQNLSVDQGKIYLRINQGRAQVPTIVEILSRNGTKIESFQIQPPSLDEVFFSATGHSISDDEATH